MKGFTAVVDKIEIYFNPDDGYEFDDIGEIKDEMFFEIPDLEDLFPYENGKGFVARFWVDDDSRFGVISDAEEIVTKHVKEA